MSTKIRLGFLGLGPRAQCLLECYVAHPQLEFVAFADYATGRAEEMAAAFKAAHGIDVKTFTSYEDMMNGAAMDALF